MNSPSAVGPKSLWGQSLHTSVAHTKWFLQTQIWVRPLIAAMLLVAIGLWIRQKIESTLQENLASQLTSLRDVEVVALESWMAVQRANVETVARDPEIQQMLIRLLDAVPSTPVETLTQTRQQLATQMHPILDAHGYAGYVVISLQNQVVAASEPELIGLTPAVAEESLFLRLSSGEPLVTLPHPSKILLPDGNGELRAGLPTMFCAIGVRGKADAVHGALALRIRPELDFTRILDTGRIGQTGETYAIDAKGRFLSNSRFDDQLKQIGLLSDTDSASSILTLEARDPGVDLESTPRSKLRRSEQPLTAAAEAAVSGKTGHNVVGYRNYRGHPVVGAWTWLPDYGIGLITEVDQLEAYQPLYILRTIFGTLFVLLTLTAAAVFVFTTLLSKSRSESAAAAKAVKQLGQYHLEGKLGQGGMGVVYRGRHALMRRPSAVKLLDGSKSDPEAIARFEREVQLSCQLTHPNTVAIFDYGQTPEGIFYYAMEYLEGLDLQALVVRFGAQPEGRVAGILSQLCSSLAEAHELGLIHRDIKPANIMLTYRGGLPDFVKVLDFGLAKAIDTSHQVALTASNALTGTPLYMAPESIVALDKVGPWSDLYAVGAVGYFLLSASPVFRGDQPMEVCMAHVQIPPEKLSQRCGRSIDADLESLIMSCLEKDPKDRPGSARLLAEKFANLSIAKTWSRTEALTWWQNYREGQAVTQNRLSNQVDQTVLLKSNQFDSTHTDAEQGLSTDQTISYVAAPKTP